MEEKRFCKVCNKETWHKQKRELLLAFLAVAEYWECNVCVEKTKQQLLSWINKKLSTE